MVRTARRHLTFIAILLVISIGPAVSAQKRPAGRITAPPQTPIQGQAGRQKTFERALPADSIRVVIHYPKAYGYKFDGGAFAGSGPTSCDVFAVSANADAPPDPSRLTAITRSPGMREADDVYECEFTVSALPFDVPIAVTATIGGAPQVLMESWKGGTQPQPPTGWWRTIANSPQRVTLARGRPAPTLTFDMTYAPIRRGAGR